MVSTLEESSGELYFSFLPRLCTDINYPLPYSHSALSSPLPKVFICIKFVRKEEKDDILINDNNFS